MIIATSMKANGKIGKEMEKEDKLGKMAPSIKGIGKII